MIGLKLNRVELNFTFRTISYILYTYFKLLATVCNYFYIHKIQLIYQPIPSRWQPIEIVENFAYPKLSLLLQVVIFVN